MRLIKFAELGVASPDYLALIGEVLQSGQFIKGKRCAEFAQAWAQYCRTDFCVPVSSGSMALTSIFKMLKTSDRPRVLIPALSFAATAHSVIEAGCWPVWCDVDEHGLLDVGRAMEMIDTRAIEFVLPVHLYGQIMDEDDLCGLSTICQVVEDACQAAGQYHDCVGEAAAFSFYPSKNLGAFGEAGAVVTNIDELADSIEAYVNYGDFQGFKYQHDIVGTNGRMDEIQAAVLLKNLEYLDFNIKARRKVAEIYRTAGIFSLLDEQRLLNAYHLYPVLVEEQELTRRRLLNKQMMETGNHYPYTLPQVIDKVSGQYPVAEHIAKHVITLPIGQHVNASDVVARFKAELVMGDNGLWRLI